MLKIISNGAEFYNEEFNRFENLNPFEIELEHSLFSISKWEAIYETPFLSVEKTKEQLYSYIDHMIYKKSKNFHVEALGPEHIREIENYISKSSTATTVSSHPEDVTKKEIITSELIYYWMIVCNIPFYCDKWNINRLLTLIRVYDAKSNTQKMSKQQIIRQNKDLNKARRAALRSKG